MLFLSLEVLDFDYFSRFVDQHVNLTVHEVLGLRYEHRFRSINPQKFSIDLEECEHLFMLLRLSTALQATLFPHLEEFSEFDQKWSLV